MDMLERLLAEAQARRELPAPAVRRLLRERAGLSQADLAQVLGVTRPAVTRWESGCRTPAGKLASDYAAVLERLGTSP